MDCRFAVNGLASKLLHYHTFSLKENSVCKNCNELDIAVSVLPIICANEAVKIDFSNLVAAIETNFPEYKCDVCQQFKEVLREFGKHVYVELPHEEESALSNIPHIITLGGNNYSLLGVILYEPALIKDMIPHYKAAVKKFNTWEEYDYMKKSPRTILCSKPVIISSLLYIMT
ncbi:uncharacterized protein LOC129571586 [Sitodiplosis mosellana]|uniref:uncharacterized protein LOC129571586 n=1 Tax=Sitodiplosis mosellana TaxID=263140 RepID=UPI0024447DFC|nr:uncharacterized protein LOC129571586 [Sitodiplosis mosellana]